MVVAVDPDVVDDPVAQQRAGMLGLPPPHSARLRLRLRWQFNAHKTNKTEREREMFYLTMHSTHFIYGYMASDIWLRTILIVRKETHCRHIGYSYQLTARVLLYAPSHRQDNTYHSLCYTSHGALAWMRNSSMGPPNEGPTRQPIAPWANTLPLSYVLLLTKQNDNSCINVFKKPKTNSNNFWIKFYQIFFRNVLNV